SPDEKNVGVLLPPSMGGAIVNAVLALAKRVAINLNYTSSNATINHCLAEAGIRHVLTSRLVMARMKLELDAELVYLEDLREKVTAVDKVAAAIQAYALPVSLLER